MWVCPYYTVVLWRCFIARLDELWMMNKSGLALGLRTRLKILHGSQPFSFKVVCLFQSANYSSLVGEKSVRFLKSRVLSLEVMSQFSPGSFNWPSARIASWSLLSSVLPNQERSHTWMLDLNHVLASGLSSFLGRLL